MSLSLSLCGVCSVAPRLSKACRPPVSGSNPCP